MATTIAAQHANTTLAAVTNLLKGPETPQIMFVAKSPSTTKLVNRFQTEDRKIARTRKTPLPILANDYQSSAKKENRVPSNKPSRRNREMSRGQPSLPWHITIISRKHSLLLQEILQNSRKHPLVPLHIMVISRRHPLLPRHIMLTSRNHPLVPRHSRSLVTHNGHLAKHTFLPQNMMAIQRQLLLLPRQILVFSRNDLCAIRNAAKPVKRLPLTMKSCHDVVRKCLI